MAMSPLAADIAFDFSFPPCDPATPPPPVTSNTFTYDSSSLLDIPYQHPYGMSRGSSHRSNGHTRSSSQCSAYSAYSFTSSSPSESILSTQAVSTVPSTRTSTPARSPIRTHGPLLLPKIRSQDQALGPEDALAPAPPLKRARTSPAPTARSRSATATPSYRRRSTVLVSSKQPYSSQGPAASRHQHHARSFTNPDSLMMFSNTGSISPAARAVTPVSVFESTPPPPSLLCSPANFVPSHQSHPLHHSNLQLSQLSQYSQPSFLSQNISDHSRRASICSLDEELSLGGKLDYEYGFAPYPGTVPTSYMADTADSHEYHQNHRDDAQAQWSQYTRRAPSPLSVESTSVAGTPEPSNDSHMPEPLSIPVDVPVITATPPSATTAAPNFSGPTSSLVTYLTGHANPAPALVRTVSFPLHDPNTKHYWWDVRQVRPWSAFTATNLVALPGATSVLSCPVPISLLPTTNICMSSTVRNVLHPETESDLHGLCAAHYVPRVNAALSLSSARPVQLSSSKSVSFSSSSSSYGEFFIGHATGDSAPAATLFGGKPTARVVGLVKSFDKFNTGMRAEGNVKRVEYLRGLAHLHYLMREHSCRYGFLLTEIELVVVRSGTEETPLFGQLEVASVPLAKVAGPDDDVVGEDEDEDDVLAGTPLTACLALWGICMLASDEMAAASRVSSCLSSASLLCPYNTHIGAPAEGTRRKAAPRDSWMPAPQLAEKRTAKRARGWVMPEDAIGRKEMGRRGVRYNGGQRVV